jgi:hypothetical protein
VNDRGLVAFHTVADAHGNGGHSCEGTGRPPIAETGPVAILRGAVPPLPRAAALDLADAEPRTPPRSDCPRCHGEGYVPGILYRERCTLCDPGSALRMVPLFRTST